MDVHFRNSYGPNIWPRSGRTTRTAAVGKRNWATEGSWGIHEGEEAWAFSTSNRYGVYYAKVANGDLWAGAYGPVYVCHEAWNSCVENGSTAAYATLGMRLIDTEDSEVHTVNPTA